MTKKIQLVSEPTNGAENLIEMENPYIVRVTLQGISDMFFQFYQLCFLTHHLTQFLFSYVIFLFPKVFAIFSSGPPISLT